MKQEFTDAEFISSKDFSGGTPAWVAANQPVTVRSLKLNSTLLNRRLYTYIWAGAGGANPGLLKMQVRFSLAGEEVLTLPLAYVVRQDQITSNAVDQKDIISSGRSLLTFPNAQNNLNTTPAPDVPNPVDPKPGSMQLILEHCLRDNFQAEIPFNILQPFACDFSADLLELMFVSADAVVDAPKIRAYVACIAWNNQ